MSSPIWVWATASSARCSPASPSVRWPASAARGGLRGALWLIALGVATIGIGAGVAHALPIAAVGFIVIGFAIGTLDVMINAEGVAVEQTAGRTLMPLMHAAWSAGAIVRDGTGDINRGMERRSYRLLGARVLAPRVEQSRMAAMAPVT